MNSKAERRSIWRTGKIKNWDVSYLTQVAQGDDAFFTIVIDTFLEHAPLHMDEILAACQERDWQKLAAAAHKYKSSTANIGLAEIADMPREIETLARRESGWSLALKRVSELEKAHLQIMADFKEFS